MREGVPACGLVAHLHVHCAGPRAPGSRGGGCSTTPLGAPPSAPQLQHVLKLSREKWEEARDHALSAVCPDNAMRAWHADKRSMALGLLFACHLAKVDLERPVGE